MSKAKAKDTVRLQNKTCNRKHNMPRELIPVYDRLNNLEFVVCIGTGTFGHTRKRNELNIIGFDDLTSSYLIRVSGNKYKQKFYVKVEIPEECEELEEKYNHLNNSDEKIEEIAEGCRKLKNLYEEKIKEIFYS